MAIAAVAKGAKPNRINLDKSMEGNDHKISLLRELEQMGQGSLTLSRAQRNPTYDFAR